LFTFFTKRRAREEEGERGRGREREKILINLDSSFLSNAVGTVSLLKS